MRLQRRLNIGLTIAITTAFILLGVFVFRLSYCRSFEALIDLYGSFKYYFCILFGFETNGLPSVRDYSKIIESVPILPSDIDGFKSNAATYFKTLVSKENFLSWLGATGQKQAFWQRF